MEFEESASSASFIKVKIDNDQFSAGITINSTGAPGENVSIDILKSHLSSAGVVYGIDENVLQQVVTKWNQNKVYLEVDRVAVGTKAEPSRESPLQMKVKHITSRNELERIRNSKYFYQISDIANKYQKVSSGNLVGEKRILIPASSGHNVKGEPIFNNEVVKTEIKVDKGAVLSNDGNQVMATINGFAYFVDGIAGVQEVNFDGAVEIVVSSDLMSAKMVVHAPGDGGKMPDEKSVMSMIASEKIVFGLHEEFLRKVIFGFADNKFPQEPVTIAEGIPPHHGENGKVEFFFNTVTSLKPKENSDGSVDYKAVDIINSVSKGAHLAQINQPSKGTPGKNVNGVVLPCKDGTTAKLPVGPNTEIDPADPTTLISSIDGIVRYTGSVVDVSEGFIIKGDVDFSTGHIKYEKSVVVTGDVKGGFNVNCGGDLQVGGVMEDCLITVGGNVLCKHGLVGQGKGVVIADGDVNIGFMKNQTVKSKKDVNIAREALNCTIFAKKMIQIHGNPLSVAGGNLVARDGIILNTVGNHSGIRTTLEVGIDFTLVEELEKTEKLINEVTVNYTKLVESQGKYNKIIALKGRLSTNESSLMDKLNESMAKYKVQMESLEKRKELIQKKMYAIDTAYIKIERSAYPGTLFKFKERNYLVKDELIGPKIIRMVDHEIKVL